MIFFVTKYEVHTVILKKIFLKIFFLCSHPSKRKSGCNMHPCLVHSFPLKLLRNSCQRQHIVVFILRFLCTKFLVFFSNLVIHSIVNKKIILKNRLLIISCYAGWKTSVSSFHVSITMINPDHHNCFIFVVFHHSHNHTSFFLLLSNPINTYVIDKIDILFTGSLIIHI